MINAGIANEVDQLYHLQDELDSIHDQWPFKYQSFSHIKALAIWSLVKTYSVETIRTAYNKYDVELKNGNFQKAANPLKRQREISRSRGYLSKCIKEIEKQKKDKS